ncbi:hypothetical protein Tco_1346280 [Tanacetum coccineum]
MCVSDNGAKGLSEGCTASVGMSYDNVMITSLYEVKVIRLMTDFHAEGEIDMKTLMAIIGTWQLARNKRVIPLEL